MPPYQVIAKNKRGYTQEEPFVTYTRAMHYAIECLDSDQYTVILINKFDQDNQKYFLQRIIK